VQKIPARRLIPVVDTLDELSVSYNWRRALIDMRYLRSDCASYFLLANFCPPTPSKSYRRAS